MIIKQRFADWGHLVFIVVLVGLPAVTVILTGSDVSFDINRRCSLSL